MKKLLLTMLVVAVFFGSVYSQSITVISPNGGENLKIGQKYFIKWKSSGIIGSSVGIKLFFKGSSLGYIQQNAANSGVYGWTIDNIVGYGKIKPGVKYQIQIKKSGVAGDLSNSFFTISDNVVTPSIKVLDPHQGTVWEAGKEYVIRWKTTGMTGAQDIRIYLFKDNVGNCIVQVTRKNTGYNVARIPNDFKESSNYWFRLQALINGKSILGDSSHFTIHAKPDFAHFDINAVQKAADYQDAMKKVAKNLLLSMVKMEIIAPVENDIISPNKDVWIIWKIKGARKFKRVTIILIRETEGYGSNIANATKIPNTGKFLWRLSREHFKSSRNKYRIKIITDDSWDVWKEKNPNISAKTGVFYISNNPVSYGSRKI